MKLFSLLIFLLLILTLKSTAQFEEPISIYGFTQSIYLNKKVAYTIKDNPISGLPPTSGGLESDSFVMQQLNLFFTRPLGDNITFFLNTEFTANYNTKLSSGDMNIQEAWVAYRPRDEFQVKFGLLLPVYNNLNEIQNRFPLFPYIIRPIVYESFLEQLVQPADYLPQRAFLQISGLRNISNKLLAEYAIYVGNLESDYNASRAGTGTGDSDENFSYFRGEELSPKNMFGFRMGIKSRNESFKFGISGTHDYDNRRTVSSFSLARFPIQQIPILGDVSRYRIASDLSFFAGPFAFEAEYIKVLHRNSALMNLLGISLDKDFVYANLTWNINQKSFIYAGYSLIRNEAFEYVMPNSPDYKGLNVSTIGGGWRLNDYIVAKGQFVYGTVGTNQYVTIDTNFFNFGLSVLF